MSFHTMECTRCKVTGSSAEIHEAVTGALWNDRREAKVRHFYIQRVIEQNIFRLQIAMHDKSANAKKMAEKN